MIHRGDSMTPAERDAARARAIQYAREHREQRQRERERAEQLSRLLPEPRPEPDPEDQARRPDAGRAPATAAPRRTDRQPVTAYRCPECYGRLPRAPRPGADARCEQCRRPRRRKTRREMFDAVIGAWPE